MKLSLKGLALATALVWGLAVFLCGLANLIWPPYGEAFLKFLSSIYPGYHAEASFPQVILATLYGLVDGGIAGLIFGWLYNQLSG